MSGDQVSAFIAPFKRVTHVWTSQFAAGLAPRIREILSGADLETV